MPGKGSYLNAAMTITSCRDCEQHTVMRRRPCSQYVPSMPIRAAPCVDSTSHSKLLLRVLQLLPGRTSQQKAVWPVQIPLRASVVALPGLLESQNLFLNVPLGSISCLLLRAHQVIIMLRQGSPVPACSLMLLTSITTVKLHKEFWSKLLARAARQLHLSR